MKNTETLHEVTGKSGHKPSTFDFLRARRESEYPTEDIDVYAEALSKMNLGDLQTHAMDKGIKPCPDRRKLESNLINQFKVIMAKRRANKRTRKMSPEELERLERQRQKSIERNGFLRTRI
jgi:hypothetical protein